METSPEPPGEGRWIIYQSQERPSWMYIQTVYNKVQTTENIQEQEGNIKLCQKTSKKASKVLESDSLDGWNQDKLVSERWKRKEQLRIQSSTSCVQHGGGRVMAANGTANSCLLIMWLLTEVSGWILRCIGLNSLLTFSQMLQNWEDGASQCRCIMILNVRCRKLKTLRNQRNKVFFNGRSQSPDLNPTEQLFSYWR